MLGWMAYWELEPFGGLADDERFETLLALLFSAHSKPGSKIPRFFDRLPPKPKVMSQDELDASIRGFFGRLGTVTAPKR